jgi:Zn-finger nucleic acid-binding protein
MSNREGVEIDYCPQCRGVWLDRGELDKIIERSTTAFGRYGDQPPYGGEYEYKRKRGWRDMFDFD